MTGLNFPLDWRVKDSESNSKYINPYDISHTIKFVDQYSSLFLDILFFAKVGKTGGKDLGDKCNSQPHASTGPSS